jgi:Fuc2NAc and GlcNAc transferase
MTIDWQGPLVLAALSAPAGLAVSWWLTGRVRRYALASSLLDHPNDRSSHTVPTPRGGGLAIVLSFAALVGALGVSGAISLRVVGALVGCGLLVALIGFLDDRAPVPARWRFAAHCMAAVAALWLLGGIPPVPLFGFDVDLGWFGLALAVVYLVWMINLYNFMDGVDALAGVEAITVALGGALCWWLATRSPQWPICLAFAACTAGFLLWNLPPARIFMGDAGSGFIGLVLGIFSLWTAQQAPQVFWCWFILLGCFVVDATTTLVRRVRRGERFHEAHRSHAYQYAARRIGSHGKVSLAIGAINVAWLLPIALLVATGRLDGAMGTLLAYAPLVWTAFRLRAGDRAAQVEAPPPLAGSMGGEPQAGNSWQESHVLARESKRKSEGS